MFDEKREQLNLCARLLQKCYTILRFHCLSIPGYFCDAGIVSSWAINVILSSPAEAAAEDVKYADHWILWSVTYLWSRKRCCVFRCESGDGLHWISISLLPRQCVVIIRTGTYLYLNQFRFNCIRWPRRAKVRIVCLLEYAAGRCVPAASAPLFISPVTALALTL